MRRRSFMKSLGALGATAALPINHDFFIRAARANTPTYSQIQFSKPAVVPQVINIFLYGGPSELAGNLSNIVDINANSQNKYDDNSTGGANFLNSWDTGGQVTPNDFWLDAGGHEMEMMLKDGEMSIYRTMNRLKDNTRAHRPSIRSSLTGSLDYDNYPGMGVTLAASLLNIENTYGPGSAVGKPLEDLVLPFISFEGVSTAFEPDGDNPLPLYLKDVSLDTSFTNSYDFMPKTSDNAELQAIYDHANARNEATKDRYQNIYDAFSARDVLAKKVGDYSGALSDPLPKIPVSSPDINDPDIANVVTDTNGNITDARVRYPNPAGNNGNKYTKRIQAAVTLALANPDALFITIGGGLGGWDDHSSSMENYPQRMKDLMSAIRSAMKHIKYYATDNVLNPSGRDTSNIVINVMGDFGRNVNLNGSIGWDHGNNQNLYTFGGSTVRAGGPSALGKIIGTTERFGATGQNRQYTRPTSNSYQAEPMSVASTVYSYFGIQNPEVLTSDEKYNPDGETQIDETVGGVALNAYTP